MKNVNTLRGISLTGVAITAAIEPDGRLTPIGSGFEKLLAAARERSLPRVHTVVVADGQDISALGLVADRDPKVFRDPGTEFCVVKAATLNEATELLAEDLRTRWGAIIDCSGELDRHTNLIGRAWLTRQVETFLKEKKSGYLLVTGQPGVGKSAFIASLIRARPQTAIYHFLKQRMGNWDDAEDAIRSLSAQLRCCFAIQEADDDRRLSPSQAFPSLLKRVSKQLAPGQQAVIFMDGLDEAFGPNRRRTENELSAVLPRYVPEGVFFVLTSRPGEHLKWLADREDCTHLPLDGDSPDNCADLRAYLEDRNRADHMGFDSDFLDRLADAAEGCFAVASRFLLNRQDLEAWRQDPARIPRGLTDWLTTEWQRLKTVAQQHGLKESMLKAILGLMAAAAEPLSYNHLSAFLRRSEGGRFGTASVSRVLEHLDDVLHLVQEFFDPVDPHLGPAAHYRFFHASFADFVHDKLSDDEKQDSHRLLAEGCGKWQELVGETRQYAVRHLVSHLVAGKQWDGVEKRLCDLEFLEAKCAAGLAFALAGDFAQAVASLPPVRPHVQILRLLEEALRRDIHFIARHSQEYPQALFQCMWNSCWWHDCTDAALYFEDGEAANPKQAPVRWEQTERPLSVLTDSWRRAKEQTTPGFRWLRSLRPPEIPLGVTGLKAVLRGHEGAVHSVAFSASRDLVVSGSADKTVRVWEAHTGAELVCLRGHLGAVYGVAFSPDARRVVSGSEDKTIRLWDADTGAELACLDGHKDRVVRVEFSDDGCRILSWSMDNRVRVWDAASGTLLYSMHRRKGITKVYSAKGPPLDRRSKQSMVGLAGEADLRAKLLSLYRVGGSVSRVAHARALENDAWHRYKGVVSAAFSPDSRRIAIAHTPRYSWCGIRLGTRMSILDAQTGAPLRAVRGPEGCIASLAYSFSGKHIVGGSYDGTLRVWDADNGAEVHCLRAERSEVYSVAFSRDGRRIVSGCRDKAVRVWDLDRVLNLSWFHGRKSNGDIRGLAISADGRRVIRWGKQVVQLWDVDSGTKLPGPPAQKPEVRKVVFSPDSRRIVILLTDHKLRVWDTANRSLYHLQGHNSWVTTVVFSPDSRRVVSGSDDGTVRLWDSDSGTELRCDHSGRVVSVAFSGDGSRVISGSFDGTVCIWDARTGECVNKIHHGITPRFVGLGRGVIFECSGADRKIERKVRDVASIVSEEASFRRRASESELLETVIESAATTGRAVAWWPTAFRHIATHQPGRIWAGASGDYICVFMLEGDA